MYNYLAKTSGYGLGLVPLLVILGTSIAGGLFMVSVANYLYKSRTENAYALLPGTWWFTPILYTLVNALLLLAPGQPYGHWAAAGIYLIIAMVYLRNNVLDPNAAELNDDPIAVGVAYMLGFIPIAIPMIYLSRSISTGKDISWQLTTSLIVIGAVVVLIAIRMTITYLEYRRLNRS